MMIGNILKLNNLKFNIRVINNNLTRNETGISRHTDNLSYHIITTM